eukprot:83019_1
MASSEAKEMNTEDIKNAKIFVSIINYRDCEGQFTIKDLFEKAANPSRVYIGYCLQYDPKMDSEDINYHYTALTHRKNIRALFVPHWQARGPVHARHLVQTKLFNGEKYYLQIDCHMRFIKNWDQILIKMHSECEDKKAILTTYPNPYDTQYLMLLKQFKSISQWNGSSVVDVSLLEQRSSLLCADKFGNDGFLRIKSKLFLKIPKKPMVSLFYAAGFNFSLSTVIQDCPSDGNLKCLFFGEESINAVRLWTNGYNFYTPTRSICYHLWNRKDALRKGVWRELFNDDKLKQTLTHLENESRVKVQRVLNGEDLVPLGTERTLVEYQQFCGVHFKTKTISDDSRYGGIQESERDTVFDEFQQNKLMDLISSFQSNP